MPIQLRHSTQKQNLPSAASHGVGLPVSDGGLGAASRALGQVANAAGNIGARLERKRDKVKGEALSRVETDWKLKVAEAETKAKMASEANDPIAYNTAREQLDLLNPRNKDFSFDPHISDKDRDVSFKDEDWESLKLSSSLAHESVVGSIDVRHVNKKFMMNHIEKVQTNDQIADTAIENKEANAISFSTLAENAQVTLIETIDDPDLTPEAKEALYERFKDNALSLINGVELNAEEFPTIQAYNKNLDNISDTIRTKAAYEGSRDILLQAVEKIRITPKSGGVTLPNKLTNEVTGILTKVATGSADSAVGLSNIENIVGNLEDWRAVGLTRSDDEQAESLITTLKIKGWMETGTNQGVYLDYRKNNPDKTATDFLQENYEAIGVSITSANPTHSSKVIQGLDNMFKNAQVESQSFLQDTDPSTAFIDPVMQVVNSSPENQQIYDKVEQAFYAAVSSFSPEPTTDSSGRQVFAYHEPLSQASAGLRQILGSDPNGQYFGGMEFAVKALEKDPSARNTVAVATVFEQLLGERKVGNFIAAKLGDTVEGPSDTLAKIMHLKERFGRYFEDTNFYEELVNGEQFATLVNQNPEAPRAIVAKDIWNTAIAGRGPLAPFREALASADNSTSNSIDTYTKGLIWTMSENNRDMSPQAIAEVVANNLSSKIQIVDNDRGSTAISFRKDRSQGNFRGRVSSAFQSTSDWVLNAVVPNALTPDGMDGNLTFFENQSTTATRYGKARTRALVYHALDNKELGKNLMPLFGKEQVKGTTLKKSVLKLYDDGGLREGPVLTDPKTGVEYATMQVNIKRHEDPTLFKKLFGGKGPVTNDNWITIQEDGKPMAFPKILLDPTEQDADDLEDRYFNDRIKEYGHALGRTSLRLSDKQVYTRPTDPKTGEPVIRNIDRLKSFFKDN